MQPSMNVENVQRLKFCLELTNRIQPGNCSHIASNIRGVIIQILKEVDPEFIKPIVEQEKAKLYKQLTGKCNS